MTQGEQGRDDLAVSLSWPGSSAIVPEGIGGGPESPRAAQPRPSTEVAGSTEPRPAKAPAGDASTAETLVSVVDHVSTLSRLVTGTSKATAAELDALGTRVDKAVAELDAIQLRVLRSLAGFDALRLRVQKEQADRPPLSDEDVHRIAEAVTDRLLASVRVETEAGQG